jgi:5-methyltetrahydropteroyltriglutamate--homocysteine methyltransferase
MTVIHTFCPAGDDVLHPLEEQARMLGFKTTAVIARPTHSDLAGATCSKLLLTPQDAPLYTNLALACAMPVDGLHLDPLAAHDVLDAAIGAAIDALGPEQILSLAVIDGCAPRATDLHATLAWLEPLQRRLGARLWIAPSCPLPAALAAQKLEELRILAKALGAGRSQVQAELVTNAALIDRAENALAA